MEWKGFVHSLWRDPRHYQIGVLTTLLIYGLVWLDFEITVSRVITILSVTLLTQYICTRLWHVPRFDARSACISGLSLCLLLRANSALLIVLTAAVTIASKFLLRWNGKHLFNPTNFGIVAMMHITGQVWVSPGQWGNAAFFGFLMACLGGLVVNRAARSDVAYVFIAATLILVFGRTWWVGEPMTIPLHRLQSGALLLFTFFMISDPKTTPNSRAGRVVFATLIAFTAWYVQYRLFRTNGLLWSLALWSAAVPLLDWLLPGVRYQWAPIAQPAESSSHLLPEGDTIYETLLPRHAHRGTIGLDRPGASRVLRFLRREGGYPAVQQGFTGRSRQRR